MAKQNIRTKILDAARASGIKNANQFGDLAKRLGVCTKSHAVHYYNGFADMTGNRLEILLEHFGMEIK